MPIADHRVIEPELLDEASEEEARDNLVDLVKLNRYFGGYRILRRIVSEFVRPDDCFSMLDIGAASGDMGAYVRSNYPNATVIALDRKYEHLELAANPKLVGDAFQLPFAPATFDFVFSSLFLHHFSNEQVAGLLAKFKTIARRAVLAIDLERGPIAYRFLPATRWLFGWHRLSLHDGPVSVQAAFKKDELLAVARQAGLDKARVNRNRPWARLSLVAPVP
ncbi:MAG TPA: methyltransferase domain-containing protein [Bryobacteraceae bacterium]